MTVELGVQSPRNVAGPGSDKTLYLLSAGSRTAVRCTTKWMNERHAYVVAPLATARAVDQKWEALACLPGEDQPGGEGQRLHVELLSADALLGPDSGKEGLLLRYFEAKSGTPAP